MTERMPVIQQRTQSGLFEFVFGDHGRFNPATLFNGIDTGGFVQSQHLFPAVNQPIPKINIQYPILAIETSNPEETKEPMKYGIVRYWGGNVNAYGNLSIAGHNNYNGTMFGKTKNLEIGDIVELTDLTKTTMQYEIYDIFVTDPNDVSILATNDETIREVTLITCTNGNRERLILKAKQIE